MRELRKIRRKEKGKGKGKKRKGKRKMQIFYCRKIVADLNVFELIDSVTFFFVQIITYRNCFSINLHSQLSSFSLGWYSPGSHLRAHRGVYVWVCLIGLKPGWERMICSARFANCPCSLSTVISTPSFGLFDTRARAYRFATVKRMVFGRTSAVNVLLQALHFCGGTGTSRRCRLGHGIC